MNRAEFMSELKYKLRRLPFEEVQNAVNYYEEYFDDAGAENEEQTIAALDSPSAVASKIIGEYAITSAELNEPVKTKKSNILLITILAIFASPIALPLAISILMIPLSIGIVFFSFFITGAAMLVAGIFTVFIGFWSFTYSFSTGLYYLGSGILVFAIGAAITLGITQLSKTTFLALQKWMGKLLVRRSKK